MIQTQKSKLLLLAFSMILMTGCGKITSKEVVVNNLADKPNYQKALLKISGVKDNNDGTLTIPMDLVYEVNCRSNHGLQLGPFTFAQKDQPEVELDWRSIDVIHDDLSNFLQDALTNSPKPKLTLTEPEIKRFCPDGNDGGSYIETPTGKTIYFKKH
ncbi:MAG: hypothetical protein ACRCXZ_02180 [Patescibacteria group bacterium]